MSHDLCIQYRKLMVPPVYTGIFFNHESHLRKPNFVSREITQGTYQISSGKLESITLGNLDTCKDWGYAGDYTKAMIAITSSQAATDYVVASGELHSICEICEISFNQFGLHDYQKYIKFDPSLTRPHDTDGLLGDSAKIKKTLNWNPKITFRDIIIGMANAEG